MRILFFLESLQCGGKERRSLELMQFLKQNTDHEIELVLTEDEIYYDDVYDLGIKISIIKRKGFKYDPALFFKFNMICRRFKPDIIHAWGKMTTFYAIPAKIIGRIPLISSLIADSNRGYNGFSPYSYLLNTNVFFSDVVLSNSNAGLVAYNISTKKAKVIHNGVDLRRFQPVFDKKTVREEFGIHTDYMVIMVATFSAFKDYDLFTDAAKEVGKERKDVTFVGVGDGSEWLRIKSRIENEGIDNFILTGKQKQVERLIASSDIGVLCTKSEGISNSIIEYMAMAKPVITTDMSGGSKELISDGITGYCTERDPFNVVKLINTLLDDQELRISMGNKGRNRIKSEFSIDRMAEEFQILYSDISAKRINGHADLRKVV